MKCRWSRKFNVSVQGSNVLDDFEVVRAAKGIRLGYVKTVKGVRAKESIVVDLAASSGDSLISGIEIVATTD